MNTLVKTTTGVRTFAKMKIGSALFLKYYRPIAIHVERKTGLFDSVAVRLIS